MPYTIAEITVNNSEVVDTIIAELAGIGYEGFEETEQGLTAYIQTDYFDNDALHQTIARYNKKGKASVSAIRALEEKNWNQEWEQNFKPIYIEDKILVRAPFHSVTGNFQYIIIIEPKMAFGTGHHETTYLMLAEMLNYQIKNKQVLDFGCGTGILAILAAMQGAASIIAIDNDEWAYHNTLENIQVNQLVPFQVRLGDHHQIKADEQFDLVLANITRNVILETLPTLAQAIQPDGTLLISGILHEDIPSIQQAATNQELTFTKQQLRGNWAMLAFQKKPN
ncbi:MAG: 50S ribosomal protein L11 methyltransferase [Sphingobacteriales bacterium]|nr:MAG: 50S ribosomal protein L11 methyltransferase [Sphingobacteriales bacterium]